MRSLSRRIPILGRGYSLVTQACGPLACNMFALICDTTKDAVVIDPSCTNKEEFDTFEQYLQQENANLKHILLTHGHPDHVAGVNDVLRNWSSATLHLHPLEEENYESAYELGKELGMCIESVSNLPKPTDELHDGQTIKVGDNIELFVVHTPGHAPGHVAFVDPRPMPYKENDDNSTKNDDNNNMGSVLLTGDLLFRGAVGRTDIYNASVEDLFASLRRIYELYDDESIVLSGHTTPTHLKRERKTNPFVDLALRRPVEWYEEAKERNGWEF